MRYTFSAFFILLLIACNPSSKTTQTNIDRTQVETKLPEPKVYRAAYTRTNDLVHTKLELKFDWNNKNALGKATLTFHPHFYPEDSLVLDARGMDLHEVSIVHENPKQPLRTSERKKLDYSYDYEKLYIRLDKTYTREEQYTIYIDYTAKPEELVSGGSIAIRDDRGLYFINADGKNPEKPKQFWTQGETESNSGWFPTIEDPQQKMTQEIYLTIDTSMITVSNGLLITSVNNHDGTRTDYWKQSLPAAPYLTMIAASNFGVVKDKWRNLEVSYYLDREYEKNARMIFGHTPEMLEFFSNKLGVSFPWEKYAQVQIHDYITGAMENTTAVVHGTNMLQDSSDYVDENFEDYISHELFHHWFGDLVTCESWSNVALNEGFANYGEYLWREYKFGRDDADHLNQGDQALYLALAQKDDPDVIRFNYELPEDMYDQVSYHKTGRILHMLRKYVGDDAFFTALKYYLETNRFGVAEIHDLRLAFEKITGEDLNWFFNQWFFNHGYPVIDISYSWNDSAKTEVVTIKQSQDFTKAPLYRIPLSIDIYHDGKVDHKKVTLENLIEKFSWTFSSKPDLINVDAEKMLLCEKKDRKTKEELAFQYAHAPLYLDRFEALQKTGDDYEAKSVSGKMVEDALHDPYWNIRLLALRNIGSRLKSDRPKFKPVLLDMASHDSAAVVRAQAMKALDKYYENDEDAKALIEAGMKDISYHVQSTCFKLIAEHDKEKAKVAARQLSSSHGYSVLNVVGTFYKEEARDEWNEFFIHGLDVLRQKERASFADIYVRYLKKVSPKIRAAGAQKIEEVTRYTSGRSRGRMVNSLEELSNELSLKIKDSKQKAQDMEKNNAGRSEIELVNRETDELVKEQEELQQKINGLRKTKSEAGE